MGNLTLAVINGLTTLIEVLLGVVLMDSFFDYKLSRKIIKPITVLAVACVFFAVNTATMSYPLKTPVEILLVVLMLFMYDGKLTYKAVFAAAWTLTLSLSSILSSIILTSIPEDIPGIADGALFLTTLRLILPKAFLMLFVFLLTAFEKGRKMNFDIKYWMILLAVPLITLAVLTVFQYYIDAMPPEARQFSARTVISVEGTAFTIPGLSIYGYIMTAVFGLLFINLLVFILFARVQRNLDMQNRFELLRQQTEMQSRSVEKLENSYMRMRELRHDMQNQLLIMHSLLENEKYDDLKSYVKSMINTVDEAAFMTISGQSAVDAILNEKVLSAHKNKISTNFEVQKLENMFVEPMDLCIILANALDNAVEACVQLPEDGEKYIHLKISSNPEYLVVSCSNPTAHTPKMQDNEYLSTKKDKANHGFGLRSIKTTADKYNGEYMTRCKDRIFTLIVKLNRTERDDSVGKTIKK